MALNESKKAPKDMKTPELMGEMETLKQSMDKNGQLYPEEIEKLTQLLEEYYKRYLTFLKKMTEEMKPLQDELKRDLLEKITFLESKLSTNPFPKEKKEKEELYQAWKNVKTAFKECFGYDLGKVTYETIDDVLNTPKEERDKKAAEAAIDRAKFLMKTYNKLGNQGGSLDRHDKNLVLAMENTTKDIAKITEYSDALEEGLKNRIKASYKSEIEKAPSKMSGILKFSKSQENPKREEEARFVGEKLLAIDALKDKTDEEKLRLKIDLLDIMISKLKKERFVKEGRLEGILKKEKGILEGQLKIQLGGQQPITPEKVKENLKKFLEGQKSQESGSGTYQEIYSKLESEIKKPKTFRKKTKGTSNS